MTEPDFPKTCALVSLFLFFLINKEGKIFLEVNKEQGEHKVRPVVMMVRGLSDGSSEEVASLGGN